MTTEQLLKTPCNFITFIANVQVKDPGHWFNPGQNDTDGCKQMQTWELPFGFDGNDPVVAGARFKTNLGKLHQNGITITMTMGSWCTSFPLKSWSTAEFNSYVSYFTTLRGDTFGGMLDGVDFDWEGYCNDICLKEQCQCGWDDKHCGDKSPQQLADGVRYQMEPLGSFGENLNMMCYIFPTSDTLQVITGITHFMKKAGYVATLVPMSTAMWTGDEDTTSNQLLRNEYVKWRKHTFDGQMVDLLRLPMVSSSSGTLDSMLPSA